MSCSPNIITANFSGGRRKAKTAWRHQWDHGQVLCVTGIDDLPLTFTAHFSVHKEYGAAQPVEGIDGQVEIPDIWLTFGKQVYCWIYVTDGESGETIYTITIPVIPRPMPEYYGMEDTGVFDAVVAQVGEYAETAQTAATNAGESATAAAGSATAAAASEAAAEEDASRAEYAMREAVAAHTAATAQATIATEKASQASEYATAAGQSATSAEQSKTAAIGAATSAGQSAQTAARRATEATTASANAAASATDASASATAAAANATAASRSASTASTAAQTATAKAGEASAAATAAEAAKDAAQTAQTSAEAAETNAGQSASTATAKAAEAAQSASGAAQSKADAEAAAARAEQAAATLTVDDALSDTSTNPVQNKVITGELTDVKSAIGQINISLGAAAIKTTTGKNLFNKNTIKVGKKLDINTGGYTDYDYSTWFVSDFIRIESGTTYVLRQSATARIMFYDASKSYLNSYIEPSANNYSFTTPVDSVFLRFCFMVAYKNTEQLEIGSAFTSYEQYKLIISDDSDLDLTNPVEDIISGMGLIPIDYSRFNLAYVKDGKCVCNDEKSTSLTSTAKYIGADLDNDIVAAEIRFGFHSESNSGDATIMLITTPLGCSSTAHIVNGSCHFAVSRNHALIEYFDENHETTATHDHVFSTPLDFDTEYKFSWKIVNSNGSQWVTVTYPDGATEILTRTSDPQFWEVNGRYIIFEHFYSTAGDCRPYYTGWYGKSDDDSGNIKYLRHDISTYSVNGPLTVAPTGQVYNLFSNEIWGGTSLDVK